MSTEATGWRTTVGCGGKAHFTEHTGKTACADIKGIWPGCTLGDLFTRPWRATTDEDHVCRYCAAKYPRACLCWNCKMKQRTKRFQEERKQRFKEDQARKRQ